MCLAGKKLLILGGSRISCEIVNKARKMGIHTGVADWYPLEKSPAKQIADQWYTLNTADTERVAQLIQEESYDGVITGFTDSVLPFYAEICNKAGVPCYGTKQQFEILINKKKYKALCKEFDISVVDEYDLAEDFTEAQLKAIKFPVLVKPSDSSGARGITICHTPQELILAYQKALAFSKTKEVLVERFIQGKEVTVFWTFIDGAVHLSGIGNRHIGHGEGGTIGLPVGYTFPSIYTKSYVEKIKPKAERMFHSLGLKNGMMFMQCLLEGDDCIVYDIGYRLTGSLEYKLLDRICGYNPLEMLIHFALTGKMSNDLKPQISPYWPRYGCNVSYLIRPDTIGKISGLEALEKIDGFIGSYQSHLEGDTLQASARGTLKQIAVRAFGEAGDLEGLKSLLSVMDSTVEIYSKDSQDMRLSGLDLAELEGMLLEC